MVARQHTDGGMATRQRILETAAALFAKRGFYGTSTREIADEVGIRQPSLFHHFESKQRLLAELLDRDLRPALERIRCHRSTETTAGVRLYAYLCDDVRALVSSPFDARGLYNDEALAEEALAPQLALRRELHCETQRLVQEGIATGEFRPVDPVFAQQVISGTLLDTIWVAGAGLMGDPTSRPVEVADFVLLGLLRDSADLGRVQGEAAGLLDGGIG
jgi:AcrR family transcriptional regulator